MLDEIVDPTPRPIEDWTGGVPIGMPPSLGSVGTPTLDFVEGATDWTKEYINPPPYVAFPATRVKKVAEAGGSPLDVFAPDPDAWRR